MSTLKEKFENINFETISDETLCFELENIKEKTNDFTDEDAIKIFTSNFNYLYFRIEKKYPTSLKDYTPPAPTAEEIAEALAKKQLEEKEEADKIQADIAKAEKAKKAQELADKYKKKPADA
jgi:hypothetical protein